MRGWVKINMQFIFWFVSQWERTVCPNNLLSSRLKNYYFCTFWSRMWLYLLNYQETWHLADLWTSCPGPCRLVHSPGFSGCDVSACGFEPQATHEDWDPWGDSLGMRGSSEDDQGCVRGTLQHEPHSWCSWLNQYPPPQGSCSHTALQPHQGGSNQGICFLFILLFSQVDC